MGRPKAPAWTQEEIAVLTEIYPVEGLNGVADALSERSWNAIYVMANKLGLRAPLPAAPKTKLIGAKLEEAIAMREVEGWAFARIAAHFGIAETSASNAILIAQCPRKGFTPAERDDKGRLLPRGLERLRWMLKKGMKPVDIQLRLGLSAGRVAEERRRYNAELKAGGKALLPPPGNGERYSGARITRDVIKQVEALLLTGLGTPKVSDRTGVSKVHCQRIRAKLLARLRRRGETIPGCDSNGRRVRLFEAAAAIPESSKQALRAMLLDRVPVRRAALSVGIGGCSAYRIRDELAIEMAARGEELPKPILPGRSVAPSRWLPTSKAYLIRYRELCREHGDVDAKRLMLLELRQEQATKAAAATASRRRPLTFDEQLERVRNGARLVEVIPLRRPDPTMTLGGVASGAL